MGDTLCSVNSLGDWPEKAGFRPGFSFALIRIYIPGMNLKIVVTGQTKPNRGLWFGDQPDGFTLY